MAPSDGCDRGHPAVAQRHRLALVGVVETGRRTPHEALGLLGVEYQVGLVDLGQAAVEAQPRQRDCEQVLSDDGRAQPCRAAVRDVLEQADRVRVQVRPEVQEHQPRAGQVLDCRDDGIDVMHLDGEGARDEVAERVGGERHLRQPHDRRRLSDGLGHEGATAVPWLGHQQADPARARGRHAVDEPWAREVAGRHDGPSGVDIRVRPHAATVVAPASCRARTVTPAG
jgi:hypothetical protein